MKAYQWSRRSIFLAAAVAIVASTSGFALASVLSPPTQVNQGANFYDGGNNGVVGYGSPALQIAIAPAGGCSVGPVTDTTTGTTAMMVVSAWDGATNCTQGDFAELFTFDYEATTSQHVDNFTVYTSIGANAVQSNYITLEIGPSSGTSLFTASIQLYVVYGDMPPAGGITNLELVISHP